MTRRITRREMLAGTAGFGTAALLANRVQDGSRPVGTE